MPTMEDETTEARSAPDTAGGGGASPPRTPQPKEAGSGSSAQRRTIATLVYDSERGSHATGTRAIARWRRRLLYQAGAIEIDLEIRRSKIAGRLRLLGQATTGEPRLTPARVTADGPSGHLESETDDVGQFMLDTLLAGDYHLQIGLTNAVIEIPWVPIRPRFPLDHDDLGTALGLPIQPPRPDPTSD